MRSLIPQLLDCLIPDSDDPRSLEVWRAFVGVLLGLLASSIIVLTWISLSPYGFATKSQFNTLYQRIQQSDERMLRTELRKMRHDQCVAIATNGTSDMRFARRFIEELSLEYWDITGRPWDKPPCEEIVPEAP